jgi:hypothetical protein
VNALEPQGGLMKITRIKATPVNLPLEKPLWWTDGLNPGGHVIAGGPFRQKNDVIAVPKGAWPRRRTRLRRAKSLERAFPRARSARSFP